MENMDDSNNFMKNAELIQNELKSINNKFDQFLNEVSVNKIKQRLNKKPLVPGWSSAVQNMTTKAYSHKDPKNNDVNQLPDRIFIKRNSLLTEMFKINHIKTIRHIFISIMMVLALQVMFNDLMEQGKIDYNFDLIRWSFDKFNIVVYTWFYMIMSTSCLVYYSFHIWSNNRVNKSDLNLKKYDLYWSILYVAYLVLFIISPAYIVAKNKLPVSSAFIVLLEQLRMLMKTHAFVRSNIPRAIENATLKLEIKHRKTNSDVDIKKVNLDNYDSTSQDEEIEDESHKKNESILCPDFSSYLYFLFAPTLVYRDNYPRNSKIRWSNVFSNFSQVIGAIMYTYYIFSRFCIPVFQHFNTDSVTLKVFIHSILNCTLPGTLLLLVGFFAFLHCWLNAFAEMLKFADRMFYKDWWNSTNYSNYYRTWNVVVHDWLYTYVYKDIYNILGQKNKTLCQFIIFLISAIFHEYVLTLAFGFFYPVLFIMFGAVGFLCMFIKSNNSNFWNFVLWIGLLIGLGGLMCLYSIEWYARQNCPQSFESPIVDYLLPRSFTCGLVKRFEASKTINPNLNKTEI